MALPTTAVRTVIQTFGGIAINDLVIYESYLNTTDFSQLGNPKSSTVLSTVPGGNPTYVRSQPDVRILNLTVKSLRGSLADIRLLQALFNTSNPSGLTPLVFKDSAGVSYQIDCAVEQFYPANGLGLAWRVVLSAPDNLPTAAVATTSSVSVTANSQTTTINNPGSQTAYPVFTITPTSKMSHANSQIRRIPISIANRSPFPWTDQVGDGYPVDVLDASLNAAALVTGSQLKTLGEDLRIVNYGQEINRWLSPATMGAAQKAWCNLMAAPMRRVSLPSFSSSTVPAAGTQVDVTSSGGTLGWPDEGHGVYDSEVVQFTRTPTGFSIVKRGARGSTATSHSAGYFYLVEHQFLTAIHDYTAATDPLPPDDRKPVQDLASSLNTLRVWSTEWINVGDRRSGAWQSRYTEDDTMVQHIRLLKFASGPSLYMQDAEPQPSAPRGNNWIMDFPVPIGTGATSIVRSYLVGWNMRIDGFLTDIEGNESLVINAVTGANGVVTLLPTSVAAPAVRLRLNARYGAVVGSLMENLTEIGTFTSIPSSATPYSVGYRFTLDKDKTIVGIVDAIKKVGSTDDVNWIITADDGQTEPDDAKSLASGLIPNGNISSGSFGLVQSTPTGGQVRLKAGDYWITYYRVPMVGDIQLGRALAVNQFGQVPIVNNILVWNQSCFTRILSLADDASPDTFIDSQDYVYHSYIQASLDSVTPYTPKIVLGADQDCYLFNLRLKNETTGDYIDIYYPMLFTGHITIDCDAKTIIDSETGLEIGFAVTPSGQNWISFVPGDNVISYNEVGVVATTLAWSYYVTQSAVL